MPNLGFSLPKVGARSQPELTGKTMVIDGEYVKAQLKELITGKDIGRFII
jgi:ATP-dependent protease HslVU (ClpYQ) ATPase subunit